MVTDPTLDAVLRLLSAADADLSGFRSAAPEAASRRFAGEMAASALGEAIGKLTGLHADLLRELGPSAGPGEAYPPDTTEG